MKINWYKDIVPCPAIFSIDENCQILSIDYNANISHIKNYNKACLVKFPIDNIAGYAKMQTSILGYFSFLHLKANSLNWQDYKLLGLLGERTIVKSQNEVVYCVEVSLNCVINFPDISQEDGIESADDIDWLPREFELK